MSIEHENFLSSDGIRLALLLPRGSSLPLGSKTGLLVPLQRMLRFLRCCRNKRKLWIFSSGIRSALLQGGRRMEARALPLSHNETRGFRRVLLMEMKDILHHIQRRSNWEIFIVATQSG